MTKSKYKEPFVIVVGSHKNLQQAFLVMDKRYCVKSTATTFRYICILDSMDFMCSTSVTQMAVTIFFLEVALLGLKEPTITVPPSVTHLLAHLTAVSSQSSNLV